MYDDFSTDASSHTGFVEGYIVEGHVPASDVERLLKERPSISDLSVPDMPTAAIGPVDFGREENTVAIVPPP